MSGEYESKDIPVSVEPEVERQAGETHEKGFLGTTRRWIRSIGAEEGGIERIPEHERTNQPPRDLFTVFFSANCCVPTLALGALGPLLFELGWWDSFCVVLFFNMIGATWPALAARFGPKLGLRTMIVPRYSFGWWPAKVLALLNILNQIGWGIVNGISGGSVLYDVGGGSLPLAVAVLLIGLVSIVVGLFGYRVVHTYERYSWIVVVICLIIVAGFGGPHFLNLPMGSGKPEISSVLSFGTTIIGYQVAWLPIAADYGVYMRETTSGTVTFCWEYAGLMLSQCFIEMLGAAIGTLALSSDAHFPDAYAEAGIGGLIGAVFDGHGAGVRGFGKFVEVLLAFSCVAVIITNIYSIGLTVQMVSTKLLVVPRLIWSVVGGVVFLVCSIAGRNHLESVMENFLNMCAYWLVPFSTILMLEHFIWRRNYEYDLAAWEDKSKLPYGIAGSVAFVVGTVLALISMSQTWWVGPIALGIGPAPFGTDISWILAFIAATVLFVPLRYWERKKWGL
jgi:NCS1 nucleoside transporter family